MTPNGRSRWKVVFPRAGCASNCVLGLNKRYYGGFGTNSCAAEPGPAGRRVATAVLGRTAILPG